MRNFQVIALFLLTINLLTPALTVPAKAASVTVNQWNQRDIDQDGIADISSWTATYRGDKFGIHVIDKNNDMKWASNPSKSVDLQNDTWLFDNGNDGRFELVVVFSLSSGGALTAKVWDDANNDAQVNLIFTDKEPFIELLEQPFPTLIVYAGTEWLLPNGMINGNLSFDYDGILEVNNIRYPRVVRQGFVQDGKADFRTRYYDLDGDGIAEYVNTKLLAAVPAQYGVQRDGLRANTGLVSYELKDYLYWPLLNYQEAYVFENYFESPPFINVDWSIAKVVGYGITGYPIETGYHINNFNYWSAGTINQANFENAMSYYDLAENNDGLPELHVRHVYWPHQDSNHVVNPVMDVNEIVYTWRNRSAEALEWDFKLSLAGTKPITSVVNFEDFDLQLVSYDKLPLWSIDHVWENTTFVAPEGRRYVSSEGIYEWSTTEGVVTDYSLPQDEPSRVISGSIQIEQDCLAGSGTCDLSSVFTDIGSGLRGEYKSTPSKPWLYFSPVDLRLHLYNANFGLWRISDSEEIRYWDISGDGYFDTWRHYVNGVETALLVHLDNVTILWHNKTAFVKMTDAGMALFHTLPPTSSEEWRVLSDRLKPFWDKRKNTLLAMFASIPSSPQEISDIQITNWRKSPSDYQLRIEIGDNYEVSGAGLFPEQLDLEAGPYIAHLHLGDTILRLEPLLPVSTDISTTVLSSRAFSSNFVKVSISNLGSQNFDSMMLRVWAQGPFSETIELFSQDVSIASGDTLDFTPVWTPRQPGTWHIISELGFDTEVSVARNEIAVTVTDNRQVGVLPSDEGSAVSQEILLATLVLLCFALISGGFAYFSRGGVSENEHN